MRSHASELGIVMVTERDSERGDGPVFGSRSRRLRDQAFSSFAAYCARATREALYSTHLAAQAQQLRACGAFAIRVGFEKNPLRMKILSAMLP